MNKRRFLIKESLKRKILSRWFLIINIILFILIFLSFHIDSIITFFGGDFKESKNILVVDNAGVYDSFKKDFLRISEFNITEYSVLKINDDNILEDMLRKDNNNIGVLLTGDVDNFIKAKIITNNGVSSINKSIINSSLNNVKKEIALNSFNISKERLEQIEKSVELETMVLSNKKVNENKDVSASIIVILFVVPSFFLITTLVQMIGSEINEEKSTKSMEIIISNVSAKDHLLSKIISCSIFTIIQIMLLGSFILISFLTHSKSVGTLSISSTRSFSLGIINDLISGEFLILVQNILPFLIISFIITFITYTLLAGVMASMTTNIDDFQQLQTPIMLIISFSFYLALMAALFEGSFFIKIMSYVPLISFMVSPILFLLGQSSIYSVIISIIIELLFLIVVYRVGIKVYRVGILNYSGDHLWKKIIKAIKTN